MQLPATNATCIPKLIMVSWVCSTKAELWNTKGRLFHPLHPTSPTVLMPSNVSEKYNWCDNSAHYSYEFAQQLHLPYCPQQTGPEYFKTAQKCGELCPESLPTLHCLANFLHSFKTITPTSFCLAHTWCFEDCIAQSFPFPVQMSKASSHMTSRVALCTDGCNQQLNYLIDEPENSRKDAIVSITTGSPSSNSMLNAVVRPAVQIIGF